MSRCHARRGTFLTLRREFRAREEGGGEREREKAGKGEGDGKRGRET